METIIENELVKELANKHGRSRDSLLPILQDLVVHNRFLSKQDMVDVARELDISAADVYGTATFYSFLDTEVRGKYVIRICKTISCAMKGKNEVLTTIEETLKLKLGETSSDRKFSLLETNCIGWCHKAPAMLINDTPYTELTPEKVTEILREYIRNNKEKSSVK
jgi:NADH-quinone oxidoreductase subunit E